MVGNAQKLVKVHCASQFHPTAWALLENLFRDRAAKAVQHDLTRDQPHVRRSDGHCTTHPAEALAVEVPDRIVHSLEELDSTVLRALW